jgi:hypothetical protein
MSKVYFHSIDRTEELKGAERSYLSNKCNQVFSGLLGDWFSPCQNLQDSNFVIWLLSSLPYDHYLHESVRSRPYIHAIDDIKTFFVASTFSGALAGISKSELILNTALRVGGDPLKIAARLHGQCEIHAWIDPCNAQWFAGLLRKAYFDCQFLRPAQGWEDVIGLIGNSLKSEIVMSFSVCEGFPNSLLSGIDYEDWINLSEKQQWQSSMDAIRDGREIKPETWDDYSYGDGWDLFRLNSLINNSFPESSSHA